jgi:hypothetical protein
MESVREAVANSKKFDVEACVVQDRAGFYYDMSLANGEELVKFCGWKLLIVVHKEDQN